MHFSIIPKTMILLRLKYIILGINLGKQNNVEQPRHSLNSQQLSY